MVKGLLCQLVHYLIPLYATMAWHPTEADMAAIVAQCPEVIHDLANERVVSIFALNCLQARHWVRADYNIVLYRIHVPIIVQCQCDSCCLSSEDGTVIWESFRQLAASRLTTLEMEVDDNCRPHSLVNLRSVSVGFIMWSLSIAILSEFDLSLFSCDGAFAYPFNEAVSLQIVFMCIWRKGTALYMGIMDIRHTCTRFGLVNMFREGTMFPIYMTLQFKNKIHKKGATERRNEYKSFQCVYEIKMWMKRERMNANRKKLTRN